MAMKPRCIVLDEPTAMLDPNGRREVIKTVHELNRQEGITVVLITHYMEEVIDADRVVVIDGGHVVMDGTPKEVFSRVKELKKYRKPEWIFLMEFFPSTSLWTNLFRS